MSPRKKAELQFEQIASKAIELDDANVHPQAPTPGAIPTAGAQSAQPSPTATPQPEQNAQFHGSAPNDASNHDSYVPDPASKQPVVPLSREESQAELKRAITGSESILVQCSTVPVMTLFPDTYALDRAKITITKRIFFRMAEVSSLRIEDVLSVSSTVGPFFGSVKVVCRVMNAEQTHEIGPFWRSEAEKIKRITHGYIIALQRRIDVSSLETEELAKMLDQLGYDERS